MAAVQWSGGKMHGGSEAKSSMMHDDKEMRLLHKHSNPDIDLSKTRDNFSFRGLTYRQKCESYDALMEKVKVKRKSSGKNKNVTLQKLVIPIPAGMQNEDEVNMPLFLQWTEDVGAILEEEYGDLLIDIDAHVDEIHLYMDARKGADDPSRFTWSRAHLHAAIVPAVLEKQKGEYGSITSELVLNGTKFSNKRNIVHLNNRIQEMTKEKYHMLFMDGSGAGKKHNTVEEMKALSAEALREEGLQIVSDKAQIEAVRKQQEQARRALDADKRAVAEGKEQNRQDKARLDADKRKMDAQRVALDKRDRFSQETELLLSSKLDALEERKEQLALERQQFAEQQKAGVADIEKQRKAVAEHSKAVVEEHKKVSAAADSLDEILNPNAAYARAVGVVERFQKTVASRQVKSACSEVIAAMARMKDGSHGQEFVECVTQPVTDVWAEAARQQKANIPERERKLFELAEQLERGQQSEDYFDLPRRG